MTETKIQVLLDDRLTPKGKPLKHTLMVKDHYQALLFVLAQAQQKTKFNMNFIQQINIYVMKHTRQVHHMMLNSIDGSQREFRKGNVTAGGFYFVNYDKVTPLTQTLANTGLAMPLLRVLS